MTAYGGFSLNVFIYTKNELEDQLSKEKNIFFQLLFVDLGMCFIDSD